MVLSLTLSLSRANAHMLSKILLERESRGGRMLRTHLIIIT